MKEISLLEKSILNTKFFDSKIKTCSVSWKEKYLGHLIGPLGLILVVNTVAALVEKFFTQLLKIRASKQQSITYIISASIIGIFTNFFLKNPISYITNLTLFFFFLIFIKFKT